MPDKPNETDPFGRTLNPESKLDAQTAPHLAQTSPISQPEDTAESNELNLEPPIEPIALDKPPSSPHPPMRKSSHGAPAANEKLPNANSKADFGPAFGADIDRIGKELIRLRIVLEHDWQYAIQRSGYEHGVGIVLNHLMQQTLGGVWYKLDLPVLTEFQRDEIIRNNLVALTYNDFIVLWPLGEKEPADMFFARSANSAQRGVIKLISPVVRPTGQSNPALIAQNGVLLDFGIRDSIPFAVFCYEDEQCVDHIAHAGISPRLIQTGTTLTDLNVVTKSQWLEAMGKVGRKADPVHVLTYLKDNYTVPGTDDARPLTLLTDYQIQEIDANRAHDLIFGDYIVIDQLGEGGMGKVFLARHRDFTKFVVIKIIRRGSGSSTSGYGERDFLREAQMLELASGASPRFPTVHNFSKRDGDPYLLMKYEEGQTLADYIDKREDYLSLKDKISLCKEIALAMGIAHGMQDKTGRPLIHRDIKPSNIFIKHDKLPLILDFGLARFAPNRNVATVSQTGAIGWNAGTPDYMPCEQWHGNPTVASDIYAFGATMYELFTNERAFPAKTQEESLQRHCDSDRRPDPEQKRKLPKGLGPLIRAMLAVEETGRPQSMKAVADTLQQVLDDIAYDEDFWPRFWHRMRLAASVAVMLTSMTLAIWWLRPDVDGGIPPQSKKDELILKCKAIGKGDEVPDRLQPASICNVLEFSTEEHEVMQKVWEQKTSKQDYQLAINYFDSIRQHIGEQSAEHAAWYQERVLPEAHSVFVKLLEQEEALVTKDMAANVSPGDSQEEEDRYKYRIGILVQTVEFGFVDPIVDDLKLNDARLRLALARQHQGDSNRVIECLGVLFSPSKKWLRSVDKDEKTEIIARLARAHKEIRQYETALAHMGSPQKPESVDEAAPDWAWKNSETAMCYYLRTPAPENWEEALESKAVIDWVANLNKAFDFDPDGPDQRGTYRSELRNWHIARLKKLSTRADVDFDKLVSAHAEMVSRLERINESEHDVREPIVNRLLQLLCVCLEETHSSNEHRLARLERLSAYLRKFDPNGELHYLIVESNRQSMITALSSCRDALKSNPDWPHIYTDLNKAQQEHLHGFADPFWADHKTLWAHYLLASAENSENLSSLVQNASSAIESERVAQIVATLDSNQKAMDAKDRERWSALRRLLFIAIALDSVDRESQLRSLFDKWNDAERFRNVDKETVGVSFASQLETNARKDFNEAKLIASNGTAKEQGQAAIKIQARAVEARSTLQTIGKMDELKKREINSLIRDIGYWRVRQMAVKGASRDDFKRLETEWENYDVASFDNKDNMARVTLAGLRLGQGHVQDAIENIDSNTHFDEKFSVLDELAGVAKQWHNARDSESPEEIESVIALLPTLGLEETLLADLKRQARLERIKLYRDQFSQCCRAIREVANLRPALDLGPKLDVSLEELATDQEYLPPRFASSLTLNQLLIRMVDVITELENDLKAAQDHQSSENREVLTRHLIDMLFSYLSIEYEVSRGHWDMEPSKLVRTPPKMERIDSVVLFARKILDSSHLLASVDALDGVHKTEYGGCLVRVAHMRVFADYMTAKVKMEEDRKTADETKAPLNFIPYLKAEMKNQGWVAEYAKRASPDGITVTVNLQEKRINVIPRGINVPSERFTNNIGFKKNEFVDFKAAHANICELSYYVWPDTFE